jgi:hypothetical protein
VCLFASSQAPSQEPSESLNFAIYHVTGEEQELIAEGRRDYTLSDIDNTPWGSVTDGYQVRRKALELKDGFRIGILVNRQFKGDGFGLWIEEDRHPEGFSFGWFDSAHDDIYRKGPKAEQVHVTYTQIDKGFEIRSVEFLTDVTLWFAEDAQKHPPVGLYKVVVSKGSVFRIAS